MSSGDEKAILDAIKSYEDAVNRADPDALNDLFWLDDPNFSEVENNRPYPFGKEHFLEISEWIRNNAQPGRHQRFYRTDVYFLSREIAYTVSLREEIQENTHSRITLIFQKKGDAWKIVHGHFSRVPE